MKLTLCQPLESMSVPCSALPTRPPSSKPTMVESRKDLPVCFAEDVLESCSIAAKSAGIITEQACHGASLCKSSSSKPWM